MTYDLTTDLPLDRASMLPPAWAEDSKKVGGLNMVRQQWNSPAMTAYSHAHYPRFDDPECSSVALDYDPFFRSWLDARNRRLAMLPSQSASPPQIWQRQAPMPA